MLKIFLNYMNESENNDIKKENKLINNEIKQNKINTIDNDTSKNNKITMKNRPRVFSRDFNKLAISCSPN